MNKDSSHKTSIQSLIEIQTVNHINEILVGMTEHFIHVCVVTSSQCLGINQVSIVEKRVYVSKMS